MPGTLAGLPNAQLLVRVRELVQRGNAVEAELLAHLGEVDARGLSLEEGCSSMFVYCQRVLHFAEGVAYKRIQAARAVKTLLERVRRQKFAETSAPRPTRTPTTSNETPSRHIPAAIRRAVSQRDGGRCTFVSSSGRRCDSREFLEFDHADAWSRSRVHPIDGITLRCRAHNQQRARIDFGEPHMARFQRRSCGDPPSTGFESSSP